MLTMIKTFDCPNTIDYVKGREKTSWTRKIFKDTAVQNIEDIGCPALYQLYNCNGNEFVSPSKIVKLLSSWFNK